MACAANLEEDSVLIFELNLFVVNAPRHVHRAIDAEHLLAVETALLARFNRGVGCYASHRLRSPDEF